MLIFLFWTASLPQVGNVNTTDISSSTASTTPSTSDETKATLDDVCRILAYNLGEEKAAQICDHIREKMGNGK